MTAKKLRGFTLIELIVVVAIIGILAALLVPSMLGYVKLSRARNFNSNAATVYRGGQLACVDIAREMGTVPPNTFFFNDASGDCICEDGNGNVIDITNYVGEEFNGYFALLTDSSGTGCVYAFWSDRALTSAMVQNQFTEEDVKNSFTSGDTPRGCHPLKAIHNGNNNQGGNNNNGN